MELKKWSKNGEIQFKIQTKKLKKKTNKQTKKKACVNFNL